ncbi:helix-turn-helix transcriptional regulator [Pseudomonas aeruginosa]|jgi:transcriptional regulator with XRE-family HTH domain|uniref:helix-turn-helix transcriptional regulator n=1 Tax=Pseudomonas aeruginosa TaxID=287 RepID=UPI0008FAFCF5|nr:helix-turn-helix transcriptional regulator [Pseudomonas aeruginosa]MBA4565262.1 helix-turn-helix transcriptional regulator [Pseudomonas aeruginosa]MDP5462944.1 helix-turn-helix transcriptional regulator [Pseudomonas aeruginosa]NNB61684.1 helix-turn-helix transcriptional regulator [Pseudomonas aeruginosa]OPD71841.1 transcriptional regulator [Pseudomonas aeruginosa]HBN9713773.1 helix-turn-helix transcriptional regulator [Pseudomonas aeruginosa]
MLCKALKLIRSYYDMSQTELSAELGLSNSYLSEIESGKKQPSIDLLQKYSDYFDIPLSSILFFSENLNSPRPTDSLRLGIAKTIVSLLEWNEKRNAAREKQKSRAQAR